MPGRTIQRNLLYDSNTRRERIYRVSAAVKRSGGSDPGTCQGRKMRHSLPAFPDLVTTS